jgi:G3E family GTPase
VTTLAQPPHRETVPVIILTGFLGSGKTTLLRHVLADPNTHDTAVLVNEFGEVALDHHLVKEVRDDLVVLGAGCVCCSVRNDLMRSLCELHGRAERGEIPRFARVIVETTGLADPAPIVRTVAKNGVVRALFHLSAVIATVDACLGEQTLARQAESVTQAAVADRLVVTKTDLATAELVGRLDERLAALNPLATRSYAAQGHVGSDILLEPAPTHPLRAPVPERETEEHEHPAGGHGDDLHSFSETLDAPVDYRAFALWLSMMTQVHGEHLLRVKGILHVADDPLPVVVESVQHVVYPVRTLGAWPFEPRASTVVAITRGLPLDIVHAIQRSLRALTGGAARADVV